MEQRNKSAYFVKTVIVLILISNKLQLKKNSYLHILLYDDVITPQRFKKSTIIINMMSILTLVINRNSSE